MKVGNKVRVSPFITADPYGKAGQVAINESNHTKVTSSSYGDNMVSIHH